MTKRPETGEGFSLLHRALSFRYAGRGIAYILRTQHNAWIHVAISCLVIAAGIYFPISRIEWILLIIAISSVLVMEIINTAVEIIVDLISPQYHRLAGIAKDLTAAAVLLAAIGSAIVGLIIFLPHARQLIV